MSQDEELRRVSKNIHAVVLEWCRLRIDAHFHMKHLTEFVYTRTKGATAPDSAGRILRDLRQRGLIKYEVVNRSQSLYRVIEVGPDAGGVGAHS